MIKKSYDRILEISKDHKQITLPDSRYYRRNGEYYPSVTYVLNSYPKGKHFEDWLKKVGYSADWIKKKSAEEGTAVHELIEEYFEGNEMNYLNERGNPKMNPEIWKMFLRFVDFWETYKPILVETETHLFSDELKVTREFFIYGFQISMICSTSDNFAGLTFILKSPFPKVFLYELQMIFAEKI